MNRAQAILNWLRTQGVRWLVAAVIAAVIWRLWCLLHPSTEAAEVLLTVLAGGGGLCVASLNSDGQRLVSNALVGILVALLFIAVSEEFW